MIDPNAHSEVVGQLEAATQRAHVLQTRLDTLLANAAGSLRVEMADAVRGLGAEVERVTVDVLCKHLGHLPRRREFAAGSIINGAIRNKATYAIECDACGRWLETDL